MWLRGPVTISRSVYPCCCASLRWARLPSSVPDREPEVERDVGHPGRRIDALVGQVRQHRAPGLVVAVVLVHGQHPEQHRGHEGQARGQDAEGGVTGGYRRPHQPAEYHHQQDK